MEIKLKSCIINMDNLTPTTNCGGAPIVKFNDWAVIFKIPDNPANSIERIGEDFVNYGRKNKLKKPSKKKCVLKSESQERNPKYDVLLELINEVEIAKIAKMEAEDEEEKDNDKSYDEEERQEESIEDFYDDNLVSVDFPNFNEERLIFDKYFFDYVPQYRGFS